jgi:hypothetical protein
MQRLLSMDEMQANSESMSHMCKLFVPPLAANLVASNKQVRVLRSAIRAARCDARGPEKRDAEHAHRSPPGRLLPVFLSHSKQVQHLSAATLDSLVQSAPPPSIAMYVATPTPRFSAPVPLLSSPSASARCAPLALSLAHSHAHAPALATSLSLAAAPAGR